MNDVYHLMRKKILDQEPLDPNLPMVLDLSPNQSTPKSIIALLTLYCMGISFALNAISQSENWFYGILAVLVLSLSSKATIEFFSTLNIKIGSDQITFRSKSPFGKQGWQATYHEYTALEFKRIPRTVLGWQLGDVLLLESVHPDSRKTIPLIAASPIHEQQVREKFEGLKQYFDLPLVDQTSESIKTEANIQDWKAAARVPQQLFYGALFFIPAIIVLGMSYYVESRILTTENWIQTSCTIVNSEMHPIVVDRGLDKSTHKVDIFYRYQFKEKEYESHNYSMGGNKMRAEKAQRVITRYPSGVQRACYINPKDPKEAILYQGSQNVFSWLRIPLWIMFGGGIIFLRRGVLNYKNSRVRSPN